MLPLFIQSAGIESAMLDNDKLMVVLGVVLIIWVGIAICIYSMDRQIDKMESKIEAYVHERFGGRKSTK